ncbi:MAG: hypothetical protein WC683_06095 [bacterium]
MNDSERDQILTSIQIDVALIKQTVNNGKFMTKEDCLKRHAAPWAKLWWLFVGAAVSGGVGAGIALTIQAIH